MSFGNTVDLRCCL